MSQLNYDHTDGVATIAVSNPPQNRMSFEVIDGITEALRDVMRRDDTRVVVIRADGPDFGYGGDIVPWLELSEREIADRLRDALEQLNKLEDLPAPVVVAAQGHCLGGSFELALRGDVIIAADDAKFGHPEATIGVFTLLGGVQRVAERVGRTRAIRWAMTCELVDAAQALEAGLVTEVVGVDGLEAATQAWVERFSGGPTLAHADHKRLIQAWANGGIRAADKMMPDMASRILFTEDARGSIKGAVEALMAGKPRPDYAFKAR